jgi:hypothetical protein
MNPSRVDTQVPVEQALVSFQIGVVYPDGTEKFEIRISPDFIKLAETNSNFQ